MSTDVPTPLQMALEIENDEIIKILKDRAVNEKIAKQTVRDELDLPKEPPSLLQSSLDKCNEADSSLSAKGEVRSYFNLTVGDAKSTCNLRGVRNRAPDEFGSFKEVPGDFHTQGYVMECLSRICGPGEFYYTIRQLLGHLKVTPKPKRGITRGIRMH